MKLGLTRDEIEALDDITSSLAAAGEVVDSAVADYITVLKRARGVRDGIASRLLSLYGRKSAKFRDSPAGDEASYYIDEWESIDLDDPVPDLEHRDRLERLLRTVLKPRTKLMT